MTQVVVLGDAGIVRLKDAQARFTALYERGKEQGHLEGKEFADALLAIRDFMRIVADLEEDRTRNMR